MQLTEIARTSAQFIVYALAGVTQAIRADGGEAIFRPEAVTVCKAEDGSLKFVGLVGPMAHFDGVSISYSGAAGRAFTREEIMGSTEDLQLEAELRLVTDILMAEAFLSIEIVREVPTV